MADIKQGSNPEPSARDYLDARDKTDRLAILGHMMRRSAALPISLASDLLILDLGLDEKLRILEATGSRDHLALEHFLTSNLLIWPQELAALALRIWSAKTNHLFWFRVAEAVQSPSLPQRVFYTALDVTEHAGGLRLLNLACKADGIETMSQALHGLILHRAVQWSAPHERLEQLAHRIVEECRGVLHPDNKALPSAVAYLTRFTSDTLTTFMETRLGREPWDDHIQAILGDLNTFEMRTASLKKCSQNAATPETQKIFMKAWPALWSRHLLSTELVTAGLKHLPPSLELFSGISEETLTQAVTSLDDTNTFVGALSAIAGLMSVPAAPTVLDTIKDRVATSSNPASVLEKVPLRLRLDLTAREQSAKQGTTILDAIRSEETQVLGASAKITRAICIEENQAEQSSGTESSGGSTTIDTEGRKQFFNLAYRHLGKHGENKTAKTTTQTDPMASPWNLLSDAWRQPEEQKLALLAAASRQIKGVLRLCYIDTLGRFHGQDMAALKLLDFTRSTEEDDLRAVIRALGNIGTARAAQELVSALTRPNITTALQLEACSALKKLNLDPLQIQLRATLNDLSVKPSTDGQSLELREALVALLRPSKVTEGNLTTSAPILGDRELDQTLSGMIPHYKELSTEVRRALRTSLFFHKQVEAESAPDSIDLSPVIDMQYKALELLFRETFEEPCSRVIQRGVLQRRLDVIGYARPVPHAMDTFEAYIASLPIVREIPFFSKFKLRKTLRAICQFRPGKRFTLDGLKAFAIFFLCFSRRECKFGLEGLFLLNVTDDKELFDFCKSLHIFQDFRNRAAHEGFHPDAAQDIVGIWRQTAEIIQGLHKAKANIGQTHDNDGARSKGPIIEKKVS
jgi:hypothetical protein